MTKLLSNGHSEQLVEQLVYAKVRKHIDLDGLHQLEEHLAIEIGKLSELTTAEMVGTSRALIDRALMRLATDEQRYATWTEQDQELHIRYLNWLCVQDEHPSTGVQS